MVFDDIIMYTDNINQQIVQALLRMHHIKYVIVSPGGTNPAMIISLQGDPYFTLYSCVDERSAAYMACGLSEQVGEPVALCCTGATASRNYMPALTEAYYRKLPIVVITCSRPNSYVDQLMPQVTNRNIYPADILKEGVHLQNIKDKNDFCDVEYKVNKALLELKHHGGGPVHLNVEVLSQTCTTLCLPQVSKIGRITYEDSFPEIPNGKIAIFIGSHKNFNEAESNAIEDFCESYNAVVLKDHTSGYYGKYAVNYSLIGTQIHKFECSRFDLLIHIGEVSGDYLTFENISAKYVWRVNEDGEIRIRFGKLNYVFEMSDIFFFKHMTNSSFPKSTQLYESLHMMYDNLYHLIPELPLCHMYLAYKLAPIMPKGCVIHFAILNALRSWNFFELNKTIKTNSNVGGFGIDGCSSSLIGASLSNRGKIFYLITGDLAFFYDLNSLGNKHITNNIRIILVNDGRGAEFCHYMFPKYEEDVNEFVAGAGHFGNQSTNLVKDYAKNLGFDYYQAYNKKEFDSLSNIITDPDISDKPILFEIFTDVDNQSDSWKMISNLAECTFQEKTNTFIRNGLRKIKHAIK